MKKRILTALIMLIVLAPLFVLGGWFYISLGIVLSFIAGFELLNMMEKEEPAFQKLKWCFPVYNSLFVLAFKLEPVMVIPLLLLTILSILLLSVLRPQFSFQSTINLIFVFIYSGVLLAMMLSLRLIGNDDFFNQGFYLFTYLLLTVIFTDIGAFFIGCSFGKHKLSPTISPKKSVEGAIGGIVIGTICGFGFYLLANKFLVSYSIFGFSYKLEWLIVLFITILLTMATEIGDLVASKLKRCYGIKDYGNLFPGHGGVMDRFDSLIFSGALFFIIMQLVYIFL
jgi:phosphatidate cytidylyltransferase